MRKTKLFLAASLAALVATPTFGQDPKPAPAPAPGVAAPAATKIKIPEGTELRIRFDDPLSSATNKTGDEFSVELEDDVTLADGTNIRAGYRGKGEVTGAEKKGMMGKAGELNLRLDYLRIGDARIRIRGQKGSEGKDGIGATVALTVLFGPLGLIKHGHDIEIPRGQKMIAYVDQDYTLDGPLPPPPKS